MTKLSAARGVKDIVAPEVKLWQYIEKTARELFGTYGFDEIRIPVFENTSLFVRSIGDTTDIVEKEMYTFSDRKGRSLTLRPEGTAGVVRAYLERGIGSSAQVSKLYYSGPMFRYERPQAGRMRQFHQIGAEIIGTKSVLADVEIIVLGMDLFNKLGVEGLTLYINSLGCADCRKDFKKALEHYLKENEASLCDDCKKRTKRNPLRVLDCKVDSKELKNIPFVGDFLCGSCKEHFDQLMAMLESLNVKYTIDSHLVRGLDYYTGTVFEIKTDVLGAQDAVAAGGRYDNLICELGGQEGTGAVGFSLGMERLVMIIKAQELSVDTGSSAQVYIATLGEKAREYAIGVLFKLRRAGVFAEMNYDDRSLKAQLRQANKTNADYALIVGDEELKDGKILLRNMEDSAQSDVALSDVMDTILKKLNI
ncbi:MAG: histidine--tRNA ligase [bacterium]